MLETSHVCDYLDMASSLATGPGPIGFRLSATALAGLDWRVLDETWALAGEQPVFDAGWTSDHLSFAGQERGGPSFESLTTLAALAHHVPGKWLGVAVISNTFRHPSVLAKSATVLDNVTGGRFILGLGSGWHAGEHDAFGIPLPPPPVLFDHLESSLAVLEALFSDAAREEPGVTLDDPLASLHGATNLPPPIRPGGPRIWLGVGRRRGLSLLSRFADGWVMRGDRPGDVPYFRETRDRIARALDAAGRDVESFHFAAQVSCGATAETRGVALATSREMVRAGATHVILGTPAATAPLGLADMAREVAEPLRGAFDL
jgi:alkanesulfonate monooxygenase SsuD/methylene tetrahydromethanopterin reductase-like flavin-dependent oxidoreductase (luciferase family)